MRGVFLGLFLYMGFCVGCWFFGLFWFWICCMGVLFGIFLYLFSGFFFFIGLFFRFISLVDIGLILGVEEMFFNKFGLFWIRLFSVFWTCGLSKLINEDIFGWLFFRGVLLFIFGEGLGVWEMLELLGLFRIFRILVWSFCCCCWRLLFFFFKLLILYFKNVV